MSGSPPLFLAPLSAKPENRIPYDVSATRKGVENSHRGHLGEILRLCATHLRLRAAFMREDNFRMCVGIKKSYMIFRKFIYKLFRAKAHRVIVEAFLRRFKEQKSHEMEISHNAIAFSKHWHKAWYWSKPPFFIVKEGKALFRAGNGKYRCL